MTDQVTEQTKKSKIAQWPWLLGIAFVLVVFISSQLFAYILLSASLSANHWSGKRIDGWLTDSWQGQFFFILLAEVIVIGSVLLFAKHYKGLKAIGVRKPKISDLGHALIVVPAYLVAYVLLAVTISMLVPGFDLNQEQDIGFEDAHGFLALTAVFLGLVILTPIAEELMARGVLYSSFKKAMPIIWAAIFTSIFFAIPHLFGGVSSSLLYVAVLDTFILSMFLVYLREKTGALWAPITLHAIKNGVAFFALFVIGSR